jgi:hypothetical protein
MDARRPSRPGNAGYKFVIRLRPSSTLAAALAFRPSRTGAAAFRLPLALQCIAAQPQPAAAAPPPGPDGAAARPDPLAVAVDASGVQPLVVLSRGAVDFGACVVGRGGRSGVGPYSTEVFVRNNTDEDMEVGRPHFAAADGGVSLAV